MQPSRRILRSMRVFGPSFVLASLMFTLPVCAQAPAPAQAPSAQAASTPAATSYEGALAEGRRLLKSGDAVGAARAFDAALSAKPNDAVALSELGWAVFTAKDYERAEDVTMKAIMRAMGNARLKSANWYNMGRIQEAEGNKEAAANAYKSAIKAQPNPSASTRLAKLASSETSEDPLDVSKLEGPFPSDTKLCDRLKPGARAACSCEKVAALRPAAPYADAKLCTAKQDEDVRYVLALQTKAGWFGRELASSTETSGKFGTRPAFDVRSAEQRQFFSGPAPQLAVHFALQETTGTDTGSVTTDEQRLMLCGIGGSGAPSCTRSILETRKETGHPPVSVAIQIGPEAVLEAKSASSKLSLEDRVALGKHQVVFP